MAYKYKLKEIEVGDVKSSSLTKDTIRTHVRNNYPEEYKKSVGVNESLNEAAIDGDRQMITRAIENMVSRKMTVGQVMQEIKNAVDQSESMSDIFKSNLKYGLREEDVEEMSTSGGAGAYLTPYAFKLTKKQKSIEESESKIYNKLQQIQKKIVKDIKANTPPDSLKSDIIQWVRDSAGEYIQHLKQASKSNQTYRQEEDRIDNVLDDFTNQTYNDFFNKTK